MMMTQQSVFTSTRLKPIRHPPCCSATLMPPRKHLIQRHFQQLELPIRFVKFFKKDYLRLLKLVKRARSRGQNIDAQLTGLLEHAADRSLNSWEHVLYEGVMADPGLMNHLEHGALPDYI